MKKSLIILLLLAVWFGGCELVEVEDDPNSSVLEVNLRNMDQLPDSLGMVYALWLTDNDGTNYFVDVIEPDASGNFSAAYDSLYREARITADSSEVKQFAIFDYIQKTEKIKVSIITEKAGINEYISSMPGANIFMDIFLQGNQANLTMYETTDAMQARYSLYTPSDSLGSNQLSGFWFVDSSQNAVPKRGFFGGNMPSMFIYEAQVQVDGQWLSTGKFMSGGTGDMQTLYFAPDAEDNIPGFPGEDFFINAPSGVTFPTNLSGSAVRVLVRPATIVANYKAGDPLVYTIINGTIPQDAQAYQAYDLQFDLSGLPAGNASVKIEI